MPCILSALPTTFTAPLLAHCSLFTSTPLHPLPFLLRTPLLAHYHFRTHNLSLSSLSLYSSQSCTFFCPEEGVNSSLRNIILLLPDHRRHLNMTVFCIVTTAKTSNHAYPLSKCCCTRRHSLLVHNFGCRRVLRCWGCDSV